MIRSTYTLASVMLISVILFFIPEYIFIVNATDNNRDPAAGSPSLRMREVIDTINDFIDLSNGSSSYGHRSTDIESVDYYSDGSTLTAILWLNSPFLTEPPSLYENINYGMYIDADLDDATGFGGIEYKVELSWSNQSKEWTKVLEKWSHFGDIIVLDNQTVPYTNFSKRDAHYVILSADLDTMLYPNKYKVLFYGQVVREGSYITDFTRWISVPQLELNVSLLPPTIELRPGETKVVEVQINSTQGYSTGIELSGRSFSQDIDFSFRDGSSVRLPASGTITIPLTVTASKSAAVGPSTIFIFANSSLIIPLPEFIQRGSAERSLFSPRSIASENLSAASSIYPLIRPPLTFLEMLFGSPENSVRLDIPQEYLIGFYGVVLSFLVPSIVRWFTRRRQSKHLQRFMRMINTIYDTPNQNKDENIKALEIARRDISTIYANGKISESDYKILNEKVSEYEEKINNHNDSKKGSTVTP